MSANGTHILVNLDHAGIMHFEDGFDAIALARPAAAEAETVWALRQAEHEFAGLFVDSEGVTLAWPGVPVSFDKVDYLALVELPSILGISGPRQSPTDPTSLPWTAAWLVTQEGVGQQFMLDSEADYAAYQAVLHGPSRLTFARFDVAMPPAFQPLLYAFTAARQSPQSEEAALGVRLRRDTDEVWTEALLNWVLQHHVRPETVWLGSILQGSLPNTLRNMIVELIRST